MVVEFYQVFIVEVLRYLLRQVELFEKVVALV